MSTRQHYAAALPLFFCFLTGTLVLFAVARQSWPEIKPISRSFYFSDVDRDSVGLYLRSPQGRPLYWFGCHSTDFSGKPTDPFHDDEYDYFGFDCHLHSLSDENG